MHLTEAARLAALSRHLGEVLAPLGLAEPPRVEPSPISEGYRNRANYVVHRAAHRPPDHGGGEGRVILGSWAPRSHDVAAMDGCLVVRPPIDRVARQLAEALGRLGVPVPPSAALERGVLRYVTIRAGQAGEALVDLVVSAPDPPWLEGLLDAAAALSGVVGVAVSVNPSTGNALRVAPSTTRRGWETVVETVGEGPLAVALQVSAATFSQLNTAVAGRMYRRAAEWVARGEPPAVVWDLYCGVGALGLTVLRALGRSGAAPALYGAESQNGSVELARKTAAANGLAGAFETVDLGRQAPAGWPAPEGVLLNPPRRGLHPPVLDFLTGPAGAGVGRLVYMSCNPASFVRDARRLSRAGYRLAHLEAHDMLPGTAHVELLAGFERGSPLLPPAA
jgi:tRNA/tmRNA/rRNA uracil-C5-methylase (TrmA/RlmC/RlmD family)